MTMTCAALVACIALPTALAADADPLDACNVVWDSPSKDSSGSMPLGNGDIGVNAWVEPNGDLVLLVSKADAWDEKCCLCKIGRVRMKFDPPLAVTQGFRQELKLREGAILIQSASSNQQSTIRLWVDANQPVIHVEGDGSQPFGVTARVEIWRTPQRRFDPAKWCEWAGCWNTNGKPDSTPDYVINDTVADGGKDRVVWYHRNTQSVYDRVLKAEQLEALHGKFADSLLNHTFGASLRGDGFVTDGPQVLKSLAPAKRQTLAITVLAAMTDSPQAWLTRLEQMDSRAAKLDLTKARLAHESWWRDFWTRSWIHLAGTPEAQTVTRGYILQRFMSACAGRGGSPIKFNGSIFNVEAKPGASPETEEGDPDWRVWGGNYWFQNTRLIYWPMLAAGDLEMMEPFFKMYRDGLALSKARIETYYRFKDAAMFPETMYFWGLPNLADYGYGNTAPEPTNSYITRYWSGALELTAIMLDHYDFTQDQDFARTTLLPLADPLIAFLDDYWQKRDANGKIIMDPAQSLETYHSAVNPLPEIAGLRYLLPRLLALPPNLTTEAQRSRWTRILREVPPVPVADVNGVKLLRPADSFLDRRNSENPELYGIFPYRLYGVGRPDLALARATYEKRINRTNKGWCQDSIQAACRGLRDEAGRLVAARAADINPSARFPAMWPFFHDWVPEQDHGANIQTTLQCMLLQADGKKLYLFPAWPTTWNVSFKLHAPYNTTVEGELRDGKVVSLKVTPESRKADVINMLDQ
ncbi:MAG: DUF5703 domain-containing protein [Verrucomicrobia bacterium]|nr:DUF5703 domain-containing protein [Verrucomicrobiota bacterium]